MHASVVESGSSQEPLDRGKVRVNDFAVKLANVNGTGSASANSLLMQAIFRMGIPVCGKNLFPSNIQGLPTWYEIRVSGHGYNARALDYDLMVDSEGIRGSSHYRMRIKRWSTTTAIEYQWRQLKSFMRVGNYLWLEFPSRNVFGFNMPTGAIIPLEAFATGDDLRQCEAWAESGLRAGVR